MTGDTMLSLTPLQLAEYQGARDKIERLRVALTSAEAERDALAKALRVAELKAAHSLANNLCADHRDKQEGKPCLACSIETLAAALGKYADDDNWIQYDSMGPRYVWVGEGEGMDIASEAIAKARQEAGGAG